MCDFILYLCDFCTAGTMLVVEPFEKSLPNGAKVILSLEGIKRSRFWRKMAKLGFLGLLDLT